MEAQSTQKAPVTVGLLILESYRFLRMNFSGLAKIAVLPLLAAVVVNVFMYSGIMAHEAQMEPAVVFGEFLANLVSIVIYAVFAVSVHRRFLLDNHDGLHFGRRELRFLGASILLIIPVIFVVLIIVPLAMLNAAVGMIGMIIAYVFLVYACTRVSLVFPAIAIDEVGGIIDKLRRSWQLMKGRVGKLFLAWLVVGVTFILIGLLKSPIMLLALGLESALLMLVNATVDAVLGVLMTAWTVLVVSVAYKYLALEADEPAKVEV